MNGTGIKGGAFGFRVSSINKLVDTKSVNNTTLLHFLERTVSKHFPEMAGFLDELEKPAEAYRVNLQDLRKGLGELRDGLKSIRKELEEHFVDPMEDDRYGKQMWAFVAKAGRQLEDLVDDVTNAETTFTDAVSFYGEEDKNMSSSEFYGIFKTFVTSYKVRIFLACTNTNLYSFIFRNVGRRMKQHKRSDWWRNDARPLQKRPRQRNRKPWRQQKRRVLSSMLSSKNCAAEKVYVAVASAGNGHLPTNLRLSPLTLIPRLVVPETTPPLVPLTCWLACNLMGSFLHLSLPTRTQQDGAGPGPNDKAASAGGRHQRRHSRWKSWKSLMLKFTNFFQRRSTSSPTALACLYSSSLLS